MCIATLTMHVCAMIQYVATHHVNEMRALRYLSSTFHGKGILIEKGQLSLTERLFTGDSAQDNKDRKDKKEK